MKSILVVKSPYCFLNPNLSQFLKQFDSNQPYVPYSAKRTKSSQSSYIMLTKIAILSALDCHAFWVRNPVLLPRKPGRPGTPGRLKGLHLQRPPLGVMHLFGPGLQDLEKCGILWRFSVANCKLTRGYPLVMTNIAIENGHL